MHLERQSLKSIILFIYWALYYTEHIIIIIIIIIIMLLSSLKYLENEGSSKLADVRISIIKKKTDFIIGILICK